MIRTFIQEKAKWDELVQIDTESRKVKMYCVDKELGFPFSEYYTTVSDMGYKSIDDCIKRMKKIKHEEVDTEEQCKKEIAGLLNLAKYRVEIGMFKYIILEDGTKYNDIVERLKVYGLSEEAAVKKINEFLN